MKRKCQTPEQTIRKLRIAEHLLKQGQTVADVCCALELSAPTYHRFQHLHGGTNSTEAKRLKRLIADAELDKAMLKELAEGNF